MKYLFTLIFTTLFSFQALAADLTNSDVSLWLKAMPTLQPWLDTHEDELSSHISNTEDPEVIFKETIGALKKSGLYKELNAKVQSLGFTSAEQWGEVSQRITFSWLALEIDANKAQIDAAKAQYDAMMNNPDIPDAQKQMMKEMMGSGFIMTKLAEKASVSDKAIIKKRQAELRAFFEREE